MKRLSIRSRRPRYSMTAQVRQRMEKPRKRPSVELELDTFMALIEFSQELGQGSDLGSGQSESHAAN